MHLLSPLSLSLSLSLPLPSIPLQKEQQPGTMSNHVAFPPGLSVFVQGIPAEWGETGIVKAMTNLFERFGAIHSVDLSDTRTYGFVRFTESEAAKRASHADHTVLEHNGDEVHITVRDAESPTPCVLHIGAFTHEERDFSEQQMSTLIQTLTSETVVNLEMPVTEEGASRGYCLATFENMTACRNALDRLNNKPTGKVARYVELRESDPSAVMSKLKKAYHEILDGIGENPRREGLIKTPARAAKAMMFYTKGYTESVHDVLNGAVFNEDYNDIVLVKDIHIFSMCEHHLAPFFGKVHIAYIPNVC